MTMRPGGPTRSYDRDDYTAKDRVFFAFLDDHDVTLEHALLQARSVDPSIKESTVKGWLSKAKRLWKAGVVQDRSSRVAKNVQPAWRQALQQQTQSSSEDLPPRRKPVKQKVSQQPDPQRRQEVETSAVKVTIEYFKREGYVVDSVESDNVGWNLNAVRGNSMLRLEVKGLSAVLNSASS
jgi:hypothetical protein